MIEEQFPEFHARQALGVVKCGFDSPEAKCVVDVIDPRLSATQSRFQLIQDRHQLLVTHDIGAIVERSHTNRFVCRYRKGSRGGDLLIPVHTVRRCSQNQHGLQGAECGQ